MLRDVLQQLADLSSQFQMGDGQLLTVAATQTRDAIPANPNRVALVFMKSGGTAVVLCPKIPPDLISGFQITPANSPIILKFADVPTMVQAAWTIQPTNVGDTCLWFEVTAVQ